MLNFNVACFKVELLIAHIIAVVARDENKLTIWIPNIKPWL